MKKSSFYSRKIRQKCYGSDFVKEGHKLLKLSNLELHHIQEHF